ncbi:flagellar hook assembly protein FlgD [Buchnera aphidicola (Rhopalosiphum padi)]|uniref:Basal-body rod modification protein FlgD n=1 Tax=Buchnera aphidicola subsp. Rhopalosiphum padi TaxID=98793 RepID=A0A4D6YG76_BUCRP|nr:flagellar hook assembly protein FlgD [Buchnera aphidicola]QCI24974.1 flagellar hook assembly protein FlgD [Buchnera aphidicola (Rhopalosiphum padi)]
MNTVNINSSINNNIIENNNSNGLDLQKNFLSLLMAQIKNQDPTDPIKNTELTSQLAQINTATGIEKLNNTVGKFSNKINQSQNIQVSSLIGHHVMIPSSQIVHTKGIETEYGMELINDTTKVNIKITDDKGQIIYIKEMKNLKAGIYTFIWDGKNLDEEEMKTAKYNVAVVAQNKNKEIPVQVLSKALVNSIITSSIDPIIDLGAMGTITLSKIRKILK